MKPSAVLEAHREEIRRIVKAHRAKNPRVFGSVLHRDDTDASDLDLLIDAEEDFTFFDMAKIALEIEQLAEVKVDVRTPEDLSQTIREKVVAEAKRL